MNNTPERCSIARITQLRRSISAISIIALQLIPSIAHAQSAAGIAPPQFKSVDENNVNLIDGMPNLNWKEISIGTGTDELSRIKSFYTYDDNNFGRIQSRSDGSNATSVSLGSESSTFIKNGSVYSDATGDGATLTFDTSTSDYIYTSRTGTIARFNGSVAGNGYTALLKSVTYPDGLKLDFQYKSFSGQTSLLTTGTVYALSSISTNTGYQLIYTIGNGVNTATVVNNVVQYCDTQTQCSLQPGSGSQMKFGETVSMSRSTSGNTASWTNLLAMSDEASINRKFSVNAVTNGTSEYYTGGIGTVGGYHDHYQTVATATSPAGVSIKYTFGEYDNAGGATFPERIRFVEKNGQKWTYTWDFVGTGVGGSPVHASGVNVSAPWGTRTIKLNNIGSWRARVETDQLIRSTSPTDYNGERLITTYGYDQFSRLTSIKKPGGDVTTYNYDDRGNIKFATHTPIPSSGQSSQTEYAGYTTDCPKITTCNKPNYTIDYNGNQTDYTYYDHGALWTITKPADANGIRHKVTYSYQQLSAHYKNSGGVVIAGDPIWKLTSETTCSNNASCAGTTDELITSYSYNDNLLPNVVSKTNGLGQLLETITKSYDSLGNVISIDGPDAGSADTKYYFYDEARRLIGEIGPYPNSDGSLPRSAIRRSYDGDGNIVLEEIGTASGTSLSALAAMIVQKFTRNTYDPALGLLVKTEVGQP